MIGAAVNEVCRMESLCKTLDTPLVISEAFASATGPGLTDLGEHQLRGVAGAQRLFTLPAHAPALTLRNR